MSFQCSKCEKTLSSNAYLKKHEDKCNGLKSNQCELCHKTFKCLKSKYRHKKNTVCERNGTMIINDHSQTTNNNTNHLLSHNTTNITINGGINISVPFPTEQIEMTEIVKNLFKGETSATNDFLMYVLSEILRETYFNPKKPEQQNIKKTIKGDKFMEFFKDGEWKFTPSSVVIKKFLEKLNHLVKDYIPEKIEEFEDAECDDNKKIRRSATKQRVQFLKNIQPYITMLQMLLNLKTYDRYTSSMDQDKHEWSEDKYMLYFDEVLYKLTQQLSGLE